MIDRLGFNGTQRGYMAPLMNFNLVNRLICQQNSFKILSFREGVKVVCLQQSRSRCYGYIFSYF